MMAYLERAEKQVFQVYVPLYEHKILKASTYIKLLHDKFKAHPTKLVSVAFSCYIN